jgi:hypothetical protein
MTGQFYTTDNGIDWRVQEFKIFVFEIFFFDSMWSKPCVINLQIRQAFCISVCNILYFCVYYSIAFPRCWGILVVCKVTGMSP